MNFTVNHETCTKCNMCIIICPSNIVEKNNSGLVQFNDQLKTICVQCGHCMAVCPTQSIIAGNLQYGVDIVQEEKNTVDIATFNNFLNTRRSVRIFKDQAVTRDEANVIANALSAAPFGVKPNNVEFTFILNKNIIQEALPILSKSFRDLHKMIKNPFMKWMMKHMVNKEDFNTVINFVEPHLDMGKFADIQAHDDITRNAPAIMLFHAPKGAEEHTIDAHIYLTYSFLAIHAMGLGATVIGLIPPVVNRNQELKKLFQVPEGNEVVCSLIFGHPKYKFKKSIVRKREKIHWVE